MDDKRTPVARAHVDGKPRVQSDPPHGARAVLGTTALVNAALQPERLLNRAEVERTFGVTKRFLEVAAVKGGGPPMIKIRRSVRYRYGDVVGWIEAHRVAATSASLSG